MNKKVNHVFTRFLRFAFKAHKPFFFIILFRSLVLAGLTIFNAYSLSIVINTIEQQDYIKSIIVVLIIACVNLVLGFLNKYTSRGIEFHRSAMEEAINLKISNKLMNIPYQYLEDPYYLDLKERAKFSIENQGAIYRMLTNIATLLQHIITLVGLATILFMYDYTIVIVILVALVIHIFFIVLSLKNYMLLFKMLVPINRKYGYYIDTLYNEKNAKDYRMYKVGSLFTKKFEHFGKETTKQFDKFFHRHAVNNALVEVVKKVEMGFIYGLIAVKTLVNKLPISSFSLYISTAISFSTTINSMIDTMFDFIQCLGYIKPFVELIMVEEETISGKLVLQDDIETIEFKNVIFSYPKTEQIILNDISFIIKKHEKISIVGLNGAGKTTIVKLLSRLYRPTSGEILVNGISIYEYDYQSYLSQLSAIFQDYKLFAYTLKENILNCDGNEQQAYEVACKVGLQEKIDSLPNGINSLYTKSFDDGGIELSGGESQKIAIARALNSNSSCIILDEPTSALDPLAEAEVYTNFNDLVTNRMAIYISHRMSSSVFCDKILVLDNGVITDFDSHKNLMKNKDSLYFKLFNSQAKNYEL